ncbi:MAG: apolipoprotein N-acyltransferase, partial [Longispora sp.]|nr:apolipoprotein N-acyltransferase [Longispora sp. (in: high G+C Gram-positive bacteria)]
VGAVVGAGEGKARNVGVLWAPGVGPVQQYTKRHPVPFAEYIPFRSVVRSITEKADLVRADFVAGGRAGVFESSAPGGVVRFGDVICFEVAYDSLVRDTVTGGAQLLVTQTNNATFNPAEAAQQLAMVRLRSVEHGRAGLMASTVGISAFTTPDGRAHQSTAFDSQAVVTGQVYLKTSQTPATRLGGTPEMILTGLALFGLLAAVALRRRAGVPPTDEEEA